MKKILLFLFFVLSLNTWGQSDFMSHIRLENEENIGNFNGGAGVVIFSQSHNLVITVTNAANYKITNQGRGSNNLYKYELVIAPNQCYQAHLEISKLGDIERHSFTTHTLKKNWYLAYKIDEVETRLKYENFTKANDIARDRKSAKIEITYPADIDMQINCKSLLDLGGSIQKQAHPTDKSLAITTLTFPISIITNAKQQVKDITEKYDTLNKKREKEKDFNQSEENKLNQIKNKKNKAEKHLADVTNISIYSKGSNVIPINFSDIQANQKFRYGVFVMSTGRDKNFEKEYIGLMKEGGRLFSLREYSGAKIEFMHALEAKELPSDLRPTIQESIRQCDVCIQFEENTMLFLSKMKKIKESGTGKQAEVVQYAAGALECLQKLNIYNPVGFYSDRIAKLEQIIEDQPYNIFFTVVSWESDASGFFEGGRLESVEVWGCYDGVQPNIKDYENERKLRAFVKVHPSVQRIGVTNRNGEADLQLDRKHLPNGFIFLPVGYNGKISIGYVNFSKIEQEAENRFIRPQYRVKLYRKSK